MTFEDSRVEMERTYDGFCIRFTEVIRKIRFHMGDNGSDDQLSSFLTSEDNRSSEKVSQIVLKGNCAFVWCTNLDSFRSGC